MRYQHSLGEPSFRVKNIDILNVSRPRGYKHSFLSGRAKHAFIYASHGRLRDTFLGDEKMTLYINCAELVFIPAGSIYSGVYLEDGTEIKIIQFDLAEGELPEHLKAPRKIEIQNARELIDPFFVQTHNQLSSHPFYYLSCLYNLLFRIDNDYSEIPVKYRKIKRALTELREHFMDNEPVSYYAELCNMSEAYFRRLFREYTGMTPIEYRNDIRLSDARQKLKSGEYNVTEAAYECGFSNLSFFIRLYKEKYGYTPKKE